MAECQYTTVDKSLKTPPHPEPTAILSLFRRHEALRAAAAAYSASLDGREEDEEMEHLFFRSLDRIEARIMALPCTCPADLAAKLIVDTAHGEVIKDWASGPIWIEARQLVGFTGAEGAQ